MLKRIISIVAISLIITGSFFSVFNYEFPVYADDLPSGYTPVTDDIDLAYAFNDYCKSRDLEFTSTNEGAKITYLYNYIKSYASIFGYNIDSMQEQLFKSVNDSSTPGVVKWYMKTGLIGMYNDIFAKLIRENDLAVGDEVDNKNIEDGLYSDYYHCFITQYYYPSMEIYKYGTPYLYTNQDIVDQFVSNGYSNFDVSLFFGTTDYTYGIRKYDSRLSYYKYSEGSYPVSFIYSNNSNLTALDGFLSIGLQVNENHEIVNNSYKLGITYNTNNDVYSNNFLIIKAYADSVNTYTPVNIYITTNNQTINNNNYEGDTIINNNGDVINYPDNPDDPDLPPSNPSIPDSGGWQDFSLPEMPNDWLIYGMEKKFPFDIPFNILFALSLLNHEPEIPKFEGDIDLQVCTWHYDIDLTPFDDIATILRKFEVLAFIIGLAILTKNLINWG